MKKIVAITSCPVGIAHTYMAAENLEKAGRELGVELKVETHGSIGRENELTAADIAEAEGVIIAADTNVDKSRFAGKLLVERGVQDGIHHSKELIEKILNKDAKAYVATGAELEVQEEKEEKLGKKVYKSLMNGVSYMVPFVVTGGLMIAVALSLGGKPTASGLQVPPVLSGRLY